MRILVAGGLAYFGLVAVTVGWFLMVSQSSGARTSLDPERVARGETVYLIHCARCHGLDLEGEPDWQARRPDGTLPAPPQDETGHVHEHDDFSLFEYVKYGGARYARRGEKSNMPGFGDTLTDAEIWAVIAYIKSEWPEDIRAQQAVRNFLGNVHNH
jgi:mono/diheme cytochrome c family protein